MLELGEPLHAFDYDVLKKRANGKQVSILTREAEPREKLTTLDGVERRLDPGTILVCDEAGPLSLAGVMGGMESEVSDTTTTILLEGASWNMINTRKTARAQNLPSEASFRFIRGVHPSMAEKGVRRGLQLMQQWAGGSVNGELVDAYPKPPATPVISLTAQDVKRLLGLDIPLTEIKDLLTRLEFKVELNGEELLVTPPDHRLDIGEGITGKADLVEEIARVYGYDRIPETRIADRLPPQLGNPELEKEERVRDLLAALGLQEVINYRWSTPEREGKRLPDDVAADDRPYLRIANPLAYEKSFLRHSVLASVLDNAERNSRHHARLALFEIGPAFFQSEEPSGLPDEVKRLCIVLAGERAPRGWQPADTNAMDFFDLKGILSELFKGLRLPDIEFTPGKHPGYHPGKCALVMCAERQLGVMGELHPKVRENYDWGDTFKAPILATELDVEMLISLTPDLAQTRNVPVYPPVVEDLAFALDEDLPAARVEELIRQTGGKLLSDLQLFDLFRSDALGEGKVSLAYRLTYQALDRTLTDSEVNQVRNKIIKRLEAELQVKLRS